ncbi:hypothetical protein PHLGIDRAFT_95901 [Phlebiopsis gigantea 11061_1 CR5-6]|uniref:Pentacotripeptide-repeat region of PRORP domain-containing protein n=1 Tax=Phlebiopsis gigantea (strain 11061_1 CR5-6) TaxID=745531 RepID=A0A0C3S3P8_PHLG1|nr:hypothetical protein PHLGIDRAFT_95901 [Phlebiopsis gigantea 11061_1 CR5-6]
MEAAERVFELMQRSRHLIAEQQFNTVLAVYASEGDIARADAFVTKFLQAPTPRQRDLHIKCHLKNTPALSFPTSALELLHDYEGRAMLPPQKAYSRCITRLLSARSATAHAHAWDLFAHMRYAAHPQPDAFLYTAMIRACASSALQRGGEPERALDLLAEMTGAGLALTRGAYTGAILACARSGRREYVQEGFRLAKEMLDSHRDARGRSAFAPTRWLFCALLEGAKRIGDLARTRWILAEMVRESVTGVDGEATVDPERAIEEAAMMHVFHAYAAYKPPFKRGMAIVKEAAAPAAETAPQDSARDADDQPGEVVTPDGDAAFARLPPQSHAEVLYEARALFARILADVAPATAGPSVLFSTPPATRSGLFTHVQLTPRLLNAYLSVHYAHAPLEDARALFGALHGELGVSRGARAHVEALERCARAEKGERGLALRFAEEAWADWQPVEARWRANKREAEEVDGTDARLVERAYVALIRIHSLTTNLDRALATVRTFVAHYPPPAVRDAPQTAAIGALRTTRTKLVGPHPLVRMFGRTEVPDDTVPPCLSFGELEALHHRLKFHGRHGDVGYVKWVCKAYEGALRRRREAVLGTKPEAKSIVKA